MIPWILGGVALVLIGRKFLGHHDSTPALPQQSNQPLTPQQQQQKAQLDAALAKAGVHRVNPTSQQQTLMDKALANLGITRGGGAPSTPPRLMQGDPLNTQQGKTYWVTLHMSGVANGAGRNTVIEEATSRGFTKVEPSVTRPPNWPGAQSGDWYVKAVAARPNTFPRFKGNTMLGGVTIVEAYEQ